MKLASAAFLAAVAGMASPAHADGLNGAYAAVSTRLQAHGGGLAPLYAACPKTHNDGWEYVGSALFVPISQTDSAVLVNTGSCNGGNGSGQYLAIDHGGVARLITDARLADMSFLATNAYFNDDTLTLYGNRWLPDDAHCCPSKKANFEFNLKTGSRKLTVLDGNN
jgi:hypothetical protein